MAYSGGEPLDPRGEIGGGGDVVQLNHDAVEIVMLMIVLAIVMRGAGGDIVLRRRAETEDHARIDHAVDQLDHRERAHRFGGDHRPRRRNAVRPGEIDLGEQHHVRAGELILEHLGQRGLMVDARIRGALRVDGGEIGREPPGGDRFRIRQRDHAVDGDARADRRPVERFQQRLGQREAGGFDEDMVGPGIECEQRLDGGDEVICDVCSRCSRWQVRSRFPPGNPGSRSL